MMTQPTLGLYLCRAVLFILCLSSFGCSFDPSSMDANGGGSSKSPWPRRIGAALSTSSSSLPFGPVVLGASAAKAITLTNTGTSMVTVFSAPVTGSGFSIRDLPLPFSLQPGEAKTATVTFAPDGSGAAAGSLAFVSNAGTTPPAIRLGGSGVATKPRSVTLSWQNAAGATGHNVYRSSITGGPYALLNPLPEPGSAFVDAEVLPGNTYYYVVTSVDSGGIESGYSREVVAAIPGS